MEWAGCNADPLLPEWFSVGRDELHANHDANFELFCGSEAAEPLLRFICYISIRLRVVSVDGLSAR
jgi:hypothetical protein